MMFKYVLNRLELQFVKNIILNGYTDDFSVSIVSIIQLFFLTCFIFQALFIMLGLRLSQQTWYEWKP